MVFLPAYKKHNTLGETADADGLADRTISFFTSAALVVAVLLYFFADAVVSVVAPGFAGETKSLCIRLVRISSPMYVFITAAAVYASMLESRGKFFASQIRQVASHIPTILAALLLYKSFGVTVLAWALVAGSLLRLLTELPFVDWGYKFRPVFGKKDKEFGQLLKRMPSALISEAVTQINTLVDKVMASGLSAGAISSLNYGSKLINVFSGLLSGAVSVSTSPQMVEFIALKDYESLSKLAAKIINIFAVVMIPVSIACILFRNELISVVYQRGAFGSESVAVTAAVFAAYSIYLYTEACNVTIGHL